MSRNCSSMSRFCFQASSSTEAFLTFSRDSKLGSDKNFISRSLVLFSLIPSLAASEENYKGNYQIMKNQSINFSLIHSINQSVSPSNPSISQSIHQSVSPSNQSISQSIHQSVSPSNQSINPSISQVINQSINLYIVQANHPILYLLFFSDSNSQISARDQES